MSLADPLLDRGIPRRPGVEVDTHGAACRRLSHILGSDPQTMVTLEIRSHSVTYRRTVSLIQDHLKRGLGRMSCKVFPKREDPRKGSAYARSLQPRGVTPLNGSTTNCQSSQKSVQHPLQGAIHKTRSERGKTTSSDQRLPFGEFEIKMEYIILNRTNTPEPKNYTK